MFDGMDRSLNCPFLSHMELVAQVTGAHTQPCMDTGPLGRFERLCSHFDIPVDSARQAAYRASVARNLANLLYGAKVTRTRDGKAASITSTFMRTSWRAMKSFSSVFMLAPGDCSPSHRVASKIVILRLICSS